MAGRFGSKFKKRTSHTTSNIRTSSSPTVSKPQPPRKTVSKPTPVRTTPRGSTLRDNPIVSALSSNPFLPEATAEPYDTNIGLDDKFIEQPADQYNIVSADASPDDRLFLPKAGEVDYDPSKIHTELQPAYNYENKQVWEILNDKGWGGVLEGAGQELGNAWENLWKPNYDPVDAAADPTPDNTDGQVDPMAVYAQENPFTDHQPDNVITGDLEAGTIGAHVPAYTEGTSFFIDGDVNNKDPSNIGFKEGEKIQKQTPPGYAISYVKDYMANDGQGEYRAQFYKPGNATAEAHQEALDLQARTKFENELQSFYHSNITAGNMNDDMMKGLHNKIDKVKMSKDYKDELYSFYDTKRTDFNSKKTNKKLSKAEKIKAKIDKDCVACYRHYCK